MGWVQKTTTTISFFGLALLSGCGSKQKPADSAEDAEVAPGPPPSYERGLARMYPKTGSKVKGALIFRDSSEGLQITGDLENLASGSSYAVSLHMNADCNSHDGKSVGSIYNPSGASPPVGLLGEARGQADAEAIEADIVVPYLRLNGSNSVVGLAVVVHAWPFDPNVSLERVPFLACGVIEGQ